MFNRTVYALLLFSCCYGDIMYPMHRMFERMCAFVAYPRHTHVYMNHANSVKITNNERAVKIISTSGLRGCMVMVVYMKSKHEQQVIMTHFHPDLLEEHSFQLCRQIRDVSQKYDYGHSIFIYPNGRSFFSKDIQEIEYYKNDEEIQQYLYKCLENSKQTEALLQSIVQEELKVKILDLSRLPYVLAPARPRGACSVIFNGEPSEVHVTLSNDDGNKPSLCQIYDAWDRKMYCDNTKNKEVMFGRSQKERSFVTIICAKENE